MSIILEALRKSENERTRDPDARLAEVSRARVVPRSRTWFVVIALLLAINAGVLAWLVLKDDQPATPLAAAPAAAPLPPAATVPRREVRDLGEIAGDEPVAPVRTPDIPPAQHPLPQPLESAGGAAQPPPAPAAPSLNQRVADAVAAEGGSRPALPPASTRPVAGGPDTSGMPTLDQLPASAGVPALAVSLHYYDGPTGRSFITINGHMARAGTPLPEGPVVEAVTADGAILNFRGQRFLLPRN